MTKEEAETKIGKEVDDGFQNDYDRMDNLVPVFKKEEVVEGILLIMDEYAKQECIFLLMHLSEREYCFSAYAPYLDEKDAGEFYLEYLQSKNK